MADTKVDTSAEAVAAGKVTAGVPAGAKLMADPPPILSGGGPRDALVTPLPGDIIPDLETKGYHVGIVAQPAVPVTVDGVTVAGFASTEPSRFRSFADLKRAAHRDESDLGVMAGVDPSPSVRMLPGVGMVDTAAIHGGGPAAETGRNAGVASPGRPVGETLGSQVGKAGDQISRAERSGATDGKG